MKVSDRFMPKQKILQADRDYTFRSYFELAEDPDEILATNCFRPLHSENEMALPLHDAIALRFRSPTSLRSLKARLHSPSSTAPKALSVAFSASVIPVTPVIFMPS